MAKTADFIRLETFQSHIEDMRNLVMCKICLKALYEPFILACGHTYCYGCLRSWFSSPDNRKKKKNCPDCRAEVILMPSHNYILRDLVHMFISRAELLAEDETVEDHSVARLAEAALLARDKEGEGLFQGVFTDTIDPPAGHGPLRDPVDGVYRCPACHWELEDGYCNHCGYVGPEGAAFSDEEDDSDQDSSPHIDTESLASDDASVYVTTPRRRYRPLSIDVDADVDADDYSEGEHYSPIPYTDEDEDDMSGFIDDEEEEDGDEPDEIDEDDMDVDTSHNGVMPRPRRPYYLISDEYDEEDSANGETDILPTRRYPRSPFHSSQSSSDGYESRDGHGHNHLIGDNDTENDQLTIYDVSDDDNRSSTPVAMPIIPRRRPIVISDDEDEEDGRNWDVRSGGRAETEGAPTGESHTSDPDDTTTTPAQSSTLRRQRLDHHRKRRKAPSVWRSFARNRRSGGTGSQREQPAEAVHIHQARV